MQGTRDVIGNQLAHQEKEGSLAYKATSIDTIHQSIDIYGVSSLNKLWIIRTFFFCNPSPLPYRDDIFSKKLIIFMFVPEYETQ